MVSFCNLLRNCNHHQLWQLILQSLQHLTSNKRFMLWDFSMPHLLRLLGIIHNLHQCNLTYITQPLKNV